MNYEIITVNGLMGAPDSEHVVIARKDGSFISFPVDETNPEYVAFLASLEETN